MRQNRLIRAAVVAGALSFALLPTACGSKKSISAPGSGDASKDATVSSCQGSADGGVANIMITNHTSKKSDYQISVEFKTSSGHVDDVRGVTATVDSGASKTAVVKSGSKLPTDVQCEIKSVAREES